MARSAYELLFFFVCVVSNADVYTFGEETVLYKLVHLRIEPRHHSRVPHYWQSSSSVRIKPEAYMWSSPGFKC